MKKLHINIISPQSSLYEGDVAEVTLPGSTAPFTVRSKHAPLISTLEKGSVCFLPDGKEATERATAFPKNKEGKYTIEINGGVAQVCENSVIICVP